jgi:hypothetical protein
MFGQNINITIYLIDLFKHCYHPGIKCKIKSDNVHGEKEKGEM